MGLVWASGSGFVVRMSPEAKHPQSVEVFAAKIAHTVLAGIA
jgi:hypothetical protein